MFNLFLQAIAVSVEDYGKDLPAVESLQRKQDEVERDMTALHSQLGVCNFLYSNQFPYNREN